MQKSNDSADEHPIGKINLNNEKKHILTLQDNPISKSIDRCVNFIGEVFSWLWLVLLIVIIGNVILRYVFSQGMIELEELQWYLYAAAWLAGLSYTFISDGHVRVDVLHANFTFKTQMWLELIGLLVLFMPFVGFIIFYSVPFVELSWLTNETSQSANGLGARWLIKGCLLFSFILLFLVGGARLLRVLSSLKHGPVQSPKGVANVY
jgi:TRAP-type mannitol/chloroaromatic compound transport system permease small subunit